MTDRLRPARTATRAVFALNGFALGMWVVHVPVIEEDTGISHSTLGVLLLVMGVAAFTGMQITGPLADRFGHRVVVPAAAVLISASLAGPGLAGGVWTLGVALALFGLGNGAVDVAMNAHAVEVERAAGRPIMSGFHAMFSVGGAAAAGLGAVLLGLDVPASTSLLAAAAVCVLAALLVRPFLLPGASAPQRAADTAPARRSTAPARLVWLMGALAFALMLAEGVANDWAALHLRDVLGAPAGTAALAFGAFSVTMTVGRFTADAVTARFGPVAVVRLGAAIAALGLATAAASPWTALAIAGWALFGVGLSGCVPQFFTAAGNLDARASGAVLARVVGLGYLGLLAGPAVIGALTTVVPLNVAFVLPIALCVVGAASAAVLRPRPELAARAEEAVRPGSET
ncbi:MFS transporter [Umezawaea beigongshangensis]|uniref:MFS transporter n=1 Tax=Umezawaea beigongshangensis TaxID=2780383 RepID=UPI0018F1C690|nr:MFS transporter [Umezawaea beigongshangensis]